MSDTSPPEATSGPELPAAGGPSDEQIRAAARIAGEHRVSRPGSQPDAPPASAERGRSPARPAQDFWTALYKRRTTRRFDPARPVPRELVLELLDAALIAPTSCNLQMWDFVVVDDPEQRERLGRLSLQVLTAPVSIFVSYGKEFSEEGHANVQSAAAAMMTMSLAAHVLGLGTFWINQLGPRDEVGRILGLPPDREVIAALAVGWPRTYPSVPPRRRAFEHVVHWNHFGGRPIPSSPRPSDWSLDLIRDYQHARVLNGNRYNKLRAWELEAALAAANRLAPRNDVATPGDDAPRWLDVLPVHGAITSAMARQHRDHRWAVLELSQDVAQFAAMRCPSQVKCETLVWDPARPGALPAAAFDRITVLNRLEALPPGERAPLVGALARALKPSGRLLISHVSTRSWHSLAQWLHTRRGGPGGVEYVLAPDPNLGPFEALAPGEVQRLVQGAGLCVVSVSGLQAAPTRAETDHRTRNMRGLKRLLLRGGAGAARAVAAVPGVARVWGQTRVLVCERG